MRLTFCYCRITIAFKLPSSIFLPQWIVLIRFPRKNRKSLLLWWHFTTVWPKKNVSYTPDCWLLLECQARNGRKKPESCVRAWVSVSEKMYCIFSAKERERKRTRVREKGFECECQTDWEREGKLKWRRNKYFYSVSERDWESERRKIENFWDLVSEGGKEIVLNTIDARPPSHVTPTCAKALSSKKKVKIWNI
jgi:hypothetical protein